MGLDARQIIRNVYDDANMELEGVNQGTASSGVLPDETEQYSWEQVIRKVYDSGAVKLRIVRVV